MPAVAPGTITRVLVAVDLSANSGQAVDVALTFASRFRATLEFLHVIEDPFEGGRWSSNIRVPGPDDVLDGFRLDGARRLAELQRQAAALQIDANVSVMVGQPAEAILDHAERGRFDLLVVGKRGRTALSHALAASVSERVVRRAPCPVLTVRFGPRRKVDEFEQI